MKRLLLSILLIAALDASAFDFLWHDAAGNAWATRSGDPFARLDREYRVDALPAQWARDGDGFRFFVVHAGEEWTCRDGTIRPLPSELPQVVSKLDLLLAIYDLGKFDVFMAWLDGSGLKPFWDAAQVMATDHPLYEQALASVQQALGLTDAEREAILEKIAKPAYQEKIP